MTLDLESRSANLIAEAIDVAVRLGPLQDSSLIGVRLGAMRRYLCAATSDVERCGVATSMEDLKDHDIIGMPVSIVVPPLGVRQRGRGSARRSGLRVTVNEALTIHRLVLSGAGLGVVSGYLSTPEIAGGRLIHVLPDWTLPPVEVTLVFPSRRELSPAVRAFTEFMK